MFFDYPHGIDFNARTNNGDTPFHYACRSRQKETIKLILDRSAERNIDLNVLNNEGKAPIIWAVQEDEYDEIDGCLKMIIKYAATTSIDLNVQDPNGLTPLHHACKSYDSKSLRAFVYDPQFGNVDFTKTDRYGRTSLHYACMNQVASYVNGQ